MGVVVRRYMIDRPEAKKFPYYSFEHCPKFLPIMLFNFPHYSKLMLVN